MAWLAWDKNVCLHHNSDPPPFVVARTIHDMGAGLISLTILNFEGVDVADGKYWTR